MKKLLYSIATLAVLCFAAGCQREVDIDPVKGELVETEFVVTLDDATVTKAAINNDAANIDKLIVAAFKKSDGTYLPDLNETNGNFTISPVENNSSNQKQFSVQAKLVRNFQYTIAFFAMHDGAPYTLGTDGSITMAAGAANDETLDAFYKAEDITLDPSDSESLSKTITLTRPLAQINILSNPADWTAAVTSGFTSGLQSSISIAKAPNKLNLFDGAISGETTLEFTQTAIPEGTVNVAAANATAINAQYVAMAYVLSSDTASPVDVTFTVPANGTDFTGFTRTVENVPNRRNYRTNLHGDLFTTSGNFTVVVDPDFGGNDNQDINIPQPTVSPLSTIPDDITSANPGIQKPTIDPSNNNVTTNLADGKLFFGIDTNSNGAITYSSSDHNVGTIDNDGVFTPVGPGTTNITVTQAAGTQTKAVGDPLAEITIVYHVTVVETTYEISKNTPENGTLTIKIGENEVTEAAAAATITVATEPAAGYQLATLTYTPEGESAVDIKAVGSFTMPAKAVAVNATFEVIPPDEYAITVTQPGNGNVIAASAESAEENTEITLSVTTTATGYEFTSWTVTTASSANVTVTDNKFSMPAEAVTVTATFSKINYTITKNAVENGSITVSSETANYGDEISLDATPADGYSFGAWDVKQGETVITVTDNKFTMPAGNVTVGATFTQNAPTKYDVIVDDATVNGTVSADKAEAAAGETVTLTITPADYYELDVLTVEDENNQAVTVNNNQFAMPEGGVTVTATFKKLKYAVNISTMTNGTVTVDETPAEWGATVLLTVTPESGYQLVENSLTVTSGVTNLTDMTGGEWAFTMPKNAVTVSAEFEAVQQAPANPTVFTFSELGYSDAQEIGTKTINPITITTDKGTNNNAPKYYNSGTNCRMYVGNTLTLSSEKYITRIEFEFSSGYNASSDCFDSGSFNNSVWTGVTKTLVFTNALSGTTQIRMTSMTITWSDQEPESYSITYDNNLTGGTISASKNTAYAGEEITLTATPDSHYLFGSWSVNNGAVAVTDNKFTMPAENVTVSATFTAAQQYGISIASGIENGSVAISGNLTQAYEGDEVVVVPTPESDSYQLKSLTYTKGSDAAVSISKTGNDYKFTMPKGAVVINAEFEAAGFSSTYTTGDGISASGGESACKVVINDVQYDGRKIGKNSGKGTITVTIPSGSTKLHFFIAGWGADNAFSFTVNGGTADSTSVTQDSGVASNSPFTLNGTPSTYFRTITLDSNTTTTVTIDASGKRGIVWGFNVE